MLYDITRDMIEGVSPAPGDPPLQRMLFQNYPDHGFECSELRMSAHMGTHLDLPAHMFADGKRQKDYAAEDFVLPALVLELPGAEPVPAAALKAVGWLREKGRGGALLLKQGKTAAPAEGLFLSVEAAAFCVAAGVQLVGTESSTIESFADPAFPVHAELLSNGVLILENAALEHVPEGVYTLVCPPLKIPAVEASPVRALLFAPGSL